MLKLKKEAIKQGCFIIFIIISLCCAMYFGSKDKVPTNYLNTTLQEKDLNITIQGAFAKIPGTDCYLLERVGNNYLYNCTIEAIEIYQLNMD